MNDKHFPKGSSKGGQFAPKNGGVSTSTRNEKLLKLDNIISLEEDKPKLPPLDSYSPRVQQLTNNLINKAKSEEEGIRNDIESINKFLGGEIVGLEHSIKTPESLASKINENINYYGNTEQKAIENADDIVRFTILLDGEEMADKFDDLVNMLKNKGYKYKYLQNRYLKSKEGLEIPGYKDLNIKMYNPNGQSFEIQVMTPEMYKAKNEKNPEIGLSGHDVYDLMKIAKSKFTGEELKNKINKLNLFTNLIYNDIEEPRNIRSVERSKYE